MVLRLQKEVCNCCSKSINIGQSITECEKCNVAIHTKCFKISKFTVFDNLYYCKSCESLSIRNYNPFKSLITVDSHSNDTHSYNEDLPDIFDIINIASQLLDNCCTIDTDDFNSLLKNTKNDFSTLFYNIDGNKTNFGEFAANLATFHNEVSVIGLAETNTNPSLKSLYPITNYNSFYQETIVDKLKGTGVALYVHKSFNVTHNKPLSQTNLNIESLFLSISHGDTYINVGVIYRPPSGDANKFIDELHNILVQLPNQPTYIMGDFNIDLLKSNEPISSRFEEIFLCQGFYPLISVPTHMKPHCSGTCIDNILTNNVDVVGRSGVIQDISSLHSLVFTLSQINLLPTQDASTQSIQYYSYCKNNIQKLLTDLEVRNLLGDNPDEPDFSHFINEFNSAIDKTCKLEKRNYTKP